jgi:FSR family fosmidomycin resistance protein-like MFS transporter
MAESNPAVLSETAAPPLLLRAAGRVRANTRLIGLLALGHLIVDVNQGSLSAVLPFAKTAHGLSYAQVGTLVLMANVTSSIVQPLFGYVADRTARRWILPSAVLLSGAGIALTGLAGGYEALLGAIIVMGLGVAAYHPEGYRTATGVAGDRKATALSWFSLGGNVGFALGPLLVTVFITAFGVRGTLGLLAPSVLVAVALLAGLPAMSRAAAREHAVHGEARGADMPGAMALLVGVAALRSWTTLGFVTFVPFYYVDYLKADPGLVGVLLFVFLGAGALGTVVAGPLADRWGALGYVRWVFLAVLPLGVLFLLVDGVLRIVVLGVFGAVLTSSFSVSIVLSQAYLPRRPGMASGLMVGFAMGTGGLAAAALGGIADRWGVPTALWISALLPIVAFAGARFLPAPRERALGTA